MKKFSAGLVALTVLGAGTAEAAVSEQTFLPDQEQKARKQLSEPFEYAKKQQPANPVVRQPVQSVSGQNVVQKKRSLEINPEEFPEDQREQAIRQLQGDFENSQFSSYSASVQKPVQQVKPYEVPQKVKIAEELPSVPAVKDYDASSHNFELVNHKEIGVVGVRGNQFVPNDVAFDSISLRPGMILEENLVKNDLKSMSSTGWFKDINVVFAEENDKAVVIYKVKEMPVLKEVQVEGGSLIQPGVLNKMFPIGKVFNLNDVQPVLDKIVADYKEKGFVAATVSKVDITDDGVLHVAFTEGTIEKIKIEGAKRTKPFVILRELRFKEGDVINSKLIQRSVQRLYATQIFDDVDIVINPGSKPGTYEIVVDVSEDNNATITLGAAYSKSDGVMATVGLQDKNFLGRGETAAVGLEFDGHDHNKNYNVSYVKPWLDKKETMAKFHIYDVSKTASDYDRDGDKIAEYDRRRIGQELTFSRATSEFTRTYLSIKHTHDKYEEPDGGGLQYYEPSFDAYLKNPNSKYYQYNGKWPATAEERRKENFGDVWSIGMSHVYDSRDNPLDTHRGKRMEYSIEQGFGDFSYTKFDADWRYYYPFGKNVLAWDTEIGYAIGKMPLSRRFRLGGINNLRGYEDDQFRGNSMLRSSLEYRIPFAKIISGVLFTDVGYAWDKRDEHAFDLSKLKVGYGLGLRIKTPMGPVRLDYGFGDKNNRKGRFYFSFGTSF